MSRAKRADTVVKFPIDRVVREHRIGMLLGVTIEAEAIDQALRSCVTRSRASGGRKRP